MLNFPSSITAHHTCELCSRLVDIRVMMLRMLRFSHHRKPKKKITSSKGVCRESNRDTRNRYRSRPVFPTRAIIHGQHSCTVKATLLKTLAQLRAHTHTQKIRWMPGDDLRHLQTAQNTPQRDECVSVCVCHYVLMTE